MCLIGVRTVTATGTSRNGQSLRLIANRDEFFARPTAALARWDDQPLIGGRDLLQGGTWLALDKAGRLAAVTNVRRGQAEPGKRSRGELPVSFLQQRQPVAPFLTELAASAHDFAPFNLIVFDGQALAVSHFNGDQVSTQMLGGGTHVISNGPPDAPWPKAEALRTGWPELEDKETTWSLLRQDQRFQARLPETGIPPEMEIALSPIFINLPRYGTRASTQVDISGDRVWIAERSYDERGQLAGQQQLDWQREC